MSESDEHHEAKAAAILDIHSCCLRSSPCVKFIISSTKSVSSHKSKLKFDCKLREFEEAEFSSSLSCEEEQFSPQGGQD